MAERFIGLLPVLLQKSGICIRCPAPLLATCQAAWRTGSQSSGGLRRNNHVGKQRKNGRICPHGRQNSQCKECGRICQHGRRRTLCKECGGSAICKHGRQRAHCKECGGSGICQHGRRRARCKECGGSAICRRAAVTRCIRWQRQTCSRRGLRSERLVLVQGLDRFFQRRRMSREPVQ